MTHRFDLHTHSNFSDGTLPPAEVVAKAAQAGVEVLFLTDHDTISGFLPALKRAEQENLKLHCGIEVNAVSEAGDVHILGYGVAWESPRFLGGLSLFRQRRKERIRLMVEKLREHGIDITFEEVEAASRETLGRPHIADALRRKKLVATRDEAFRKYLYRGRPGYVAPMGPSPEEAIALIKEAGGFASLAHPGAVKEIAQVENWARSGLEGMEVYYGSHGPSDIAYYAGIAQKWGLLPTGGSDFHGPGTGRRDRLGVDVPDEVFGQFMERLSKCK